MMKRKSRGSLLIEVVISMLVFLIGILALTGSLGYSLRTVVKSRQAISSDAQIENAAEEDVMYMALSPDMDGKTPADTQGGKAGLSVLKLNDTKLTLKAGTNDTSGVAETDANLNLYRYKYAADVKYKAAFYLFKRAK